MQCRRLIVSLERCESWIPLHCSVGRPGAQSSGRLEVKRQREEGLPARERVGVSQRRRRCGGESKTHHSASSAAGKGKSSPKFCLYREQSTLVASTSHGSAIAGREGNAHGRQHGSEEVEGRLRRRLCPRCALAAILRQSRPHGLRRLTPRHRAGCGSRGAVSSADPAAAACRPRGKDAHACGRTR